ncbi:MAG TPA: NAD-binding protein, partial [Sphingomicrobium sp.]
GFAAALMLKDLKLAMEAARQVGLELEMGEEAEEEFEKFVEAGGGTRDFSGIIQMIDGSWKPQSA